MARSTSSKVEEAVAAALAELAEQAEAQGLPAPTAEDAQARIKWLEYQGLLEQQERASVAVWYCPDATLKGYKFVRCGRSRNATPKELARAAETRRLRLAMGWRDAPAGTRCSLYPDDGDDGIYMVIHPIGYREYLADKRRRLDAEMRRARGQFVENTRHEIMSRTGGKAEVWVKGTGVDGRVKLGERSFTG